MGHCRRRCACRRRRNACQGGTGSASCDLKHIRARAQLSVQLRYLNARDTNAHFVGRTAEAARTTLGLPAGASRKSCCAFLCVRTCKHGRGK